MDKYKSTAITSRGWFNMLDTHTVRQYLSQFPSGAKLTIVFEPEKPKKDPKTYPQLKLIHRLIEIIDKDQSSFQFEKTKQDVKENIGFYEYIESPITKKEEKYYRSFGSMSKEEGIEVINQILELAKWLGIFIPPDNDLEFWLSQ